MTYKVALEPDCFHILFNRSLYISNFGYIYIDVTVLFGWKTRISRSLKIRLIAADSLKRSLCQYQSVLCRKTCSNWLLYILWCTILKKLTCKYFRPRRVVMFYFCSSSRPFKISTISSSSSNACRLFRLFKDPPFLLCLLLLNISD